MTSVQHQLVQRELLTWRMDNSKVCEKLGRSEEHVEVLLKSMADGVRRVMVQKVNVKSLLMAKTKELAVVFGLNTEAITARIKKLELREKYGR